MSNTVDEQEYKKNAEMIQKLHDLLFYLFSAGAVIEDELKSANHLTSYMMQTFTNCIELGMGKRMLPISVIDVWTAYLGGDKKLFTYRLGTLGGEPYHELNLQRISQLLEEAVVQWGDENWGGIIKSGIDHPRWVLEDEDDEV